MNEVEVVEEAAVVVLVVTVVEESQVEQALTKTVTKMAHLPGQEVRLYYTHKDPYG